uniref:Uncharacterized protein n=2 Tax=Parascaris univalens TaxID=6257 RepID=A0A915C6S4_PARUN
MIHSEDREDIKQQLAWNYNIPPHVTCLQDLLTPGGMHYLERNVNARFRCLLDNTCGFLRIDIRGKLMSLHGLPHSFVLGRSDANSSGNTVLGLVAICSPFVPPNVVDQPVEDPILKTKHSLDFTLISMDNRVRAMLEIEDKHLPKSFYSIVHVDDALCLAEAHKEVAASAVTNIPNTISGLGVKLSNSQSSHNHNIYAPQNISSGNVLQAPVAMLSATRSTPQQTSTRGRKKKKQPVEPTNQPFNHQSMPINIMPLEQHEPYEHHQQHILNYYQQHAADEHQQHLIAAAAAACVGAGGITTVSNSDDFSAVACHATPGTSSSAIHGLLQLPQEITTSFPALSAYLTPDSVAPAGLRPDTNAYWPSSKTTTYWPTPSDLYYQNYPNSATGAVVPSPQRPSPQQTQLLSTSGFSHRQLTALKSPNIFETDSSSTEIALSYDTGTDYKNLLNLSDYTHTMRVNPTNVSAATAAVSRDVGVGGFKLAPKFEPSSSQIYEKQEDRRVTSRSTLQIGVLCDDRRRVETIAACHCACVCIHVWWSRDAELSRYARAYCAKMTRSYANVVSSKFLHRLQNSSDSQKPTSNLESEHATCSSESAWDSFVMPPSVKNSISVASSPSSGYCTPNSTFSQGSASSSSSPSPSCESPQVCDDYGSKMFVYSEWDTFLRANLLIACESPMVKRHVVRYPYPVYETSEHCVYRPECDVGVRFSNGAPRANVPQRINQQPQRRRFM